MANNNEHISATTNAASMVTWFKGYPRSGISCASPISRHHEIISRFFQAASGINNSLRFITIKNGHPKISNALHER